MDAQAILIAIIGSGAFSTIVSLIVGQINKYFESKSGMSNGMRLILKDRLRFLCIRYIEQGWIYADELEDLLSMHACYHTKLDGNGYLDTLIDRVKKLEIRGVGM